jgi:hypothetical protein
MAPSPSRPRAAIRNVARSPSVRHTAVFLCFLVAFLCASLLARPPYAHALDWSPEQLVGGDDNYDDWGPEIETTPDGVAWVVWMGMDPVDYDGEICYSRHIDGEWTPRELVHVNNLNEDALPRISVGADGVPWVLWQRHTTGGYDLLICHWQEDGWTQPQVVRDNGGRYDGYRMCAVNSDDVWVVTDAYVTSGQPRMILTYHWDGSAWSTPWVVGFPDAYDLGPDIAVSHEGEPWLAWRSWNFDTDERIIKYSTFQGTGWSQPGIINDEIGNVSSPTIAFDERGRAIALWEGNGHLGPSADIKYSVFEDGAWSLAGLVNAPDGYYDSNIRVTCDEGPGGEIWAVWNSVDALELHADDVTASKWTGTGWTSEEAICDTTWGKADHYPQVDVALDGKVWATWMVYQDIPPYDYEIRATYSVDTTPVDFCCLQAEPRDDYVHLSWYAGGAASGGRFSVWRAGGPDSVMVDSGSPTPDAVRLNECAITGPPFSWDDEDTPAARELYYWIQWQDADHSRFLGPAHVSMATSNSGLPARLLFSLPNPSTDGRCCIGYELFAAGDVALDIYDAAGRRVRSVSAGWQQPGRYDLGENLLCWDGRTDKGREVASGVYYARLLYDGLPVEHQMAKLAIVR